jgi:hypothetical protein
VSRTLDSYFATKTATPLTAAATANNSVSHTANVASSMNRDDQAPLSDTGIGLPVVSNSQNRLPTKRDKPVDWSPIAPNPTQRKTDNEAVTNAELKELLLNQTQIITQQLATFQSEFNQFKVSITKDHEILTRENENLKTALCEANERIERLENYNRRYNLVFHQFSIPNGQDPLDRILTFIKRDMSLDHIDKRWIVNCHFLKSKSKIKPIIVRFMSYYDRQAVLKKYRQLKRCGNTTFNTSNVRISEHFSQATYAKRKLLSPYQQAAFNRGEKCFFVEDKLIIGKEAYVWDNVNSCPTLLVKKRKTPENQETNRPSTVPSASPAAKTSRETAGAKRNGTMQATAYPTAVTMRQVRASNHQLNRNHRPKRGQRARPLTRPHVTRQTSESSWEQLSGDNGNPEEIDVDGDRPPRDQSHSEENRTVDDCQ